MSSMRLGVLLRAAGELWCPFVPWVVEYLRAQGYPQGEVLRKR